jgi:hypothetical protein
LWYLHSAHDLHDVHDTAAGLNVVTAAYLWWFRYDDPSWDDVRSG